MEPVTELKTKKITIDPSVLVGPASTQKMPTIFIIHGPPGAGKTTLAASMSKKWPGVRANLRKEERTPVFLDDTLFLTGDPDGLASLAAVGVDAPQINLVELWEQLGYLNALAHLPKLITYAYEKYPNLSRAVFDLTAADEEAQAQCKDIDDKRQFYGAVLECHRRTCSFIRSTGFSYWALLAHSKAYSEGETSDSKRQATALRMAGGGAIVPSVVGQGLSRYQRAVSLQLALVVKDPGAGRPVTRHLQTVTDPTAFQAKNRYEHLLKREEEPDLGSIIARIEAVKASLTEGMK